ncbi:hypothetical protein BGP84_14430 [Pseudomonas putida]|jgi:hypothetical protein|uniref:Uncharacterized protein n=1 Tax=Pseudomonas putida TaxID=303 RepID=A0A2S3X5K4_PSEPU|nr:hypothetical protein BGP84_14430 [Pseudomonas putida]POG15220.1 hypothetical protein BGP85_03300 [Pseudomonas putida]
MLLALRCMEARVEAIDPRKRQYIWLRRVGSVHARVGSRPTAAGRVREGEAKHDVKVVLAQVLAL